MTAIPASSPPIKVLVVDDLPENVEILTRLLTSRGFKAHRALDGELALQSARQFPPDLILLDINMPGLSGYEVAAQLKQDKLLCEIPIIFLSALEETVDKVRAFAAGGVDYVTKPFQFEEVEARMTTHLKLRQLQIELKQRNLECETANQELRRLENLRDNLTAASKFAMWWTYYQQFDCQSAESECRRSALDFLHVFDKFVERDGRIVATLKNRSVERTVVLLRAWANESSEATLSNDSLSLSKVLLFLAIFGSYIEGQISSAAPSTDQMVDPAVASRLESYLKWRGHFPRLKSRVDLQLVMEKACHSSTIVVVGDIRRSQDLMTYATDEQDFSSRMVEFISKTRSVLNKHGGFFDKFTGDGFLGYFNESICENYGSNYIDSFVDFILEFTGFCNAHFREWVKFVRKVPGQTVGLAVGADVGRVTFQSLDYHVVAVSESIVWASRMASAAMAEEVLVNNLLYQTLRRRKDLEFESREANTKSGESFQAWKITTKKLAPSLVSEGRASSPERRKGVAALTRPLPARIPD
jgi:DNA-binding response OmpR family regulator/class 3 adenylate cyclase